MSSLPSSDPPAARSPGDEGPRLTVIEHLDELRRRLLVSVATLLVTIGISLWQVERLVRWLQRPIEGLVPRLVFFSPTEPLVAYLQVAMLSGVTLAMPMALFQLWRFVRLGLTAPERTMGLAFIWWGSLLFGGGVAFAYYGLLPLSLTVLLGIGKGSLEPMISIGRYLSLVTTMAFWCGVIFELPVVLFLLATVGIVTPAWLRQQRPYALLALVTIAAVMTPTTDPFSLLVATIPMALLYELSILVISVTGRRRAS